MKSLTLFILFVFSVTMSYGVTRFMVVGDTHHYSPSDNFKESILYEITLAAIEEKVDFVFFTGDLVLNDYPENSNIDSLLYDWKFVLDTLYANEIKVYACRGNNDVNSNETWKILFSGKYTLPDDGPEDEKYYTYSFECDDFLFLSLDQYTEYNKINQEWLEKKLKENKKQFVFAASHEPAFKVFHTGLSAYPDERNNFWKSLAENSGKVYFCGHDHFYDHSVMLDGDGIPSNDVHQIIVGTGGGGFHPESEYNGDNGSWEPTQIYHENSFGYLLVEVNNKSLKTIWKHRIDRLNFMDGGDNYNYLVTSIDSKTAGPKEYELSQNYPNPFNPSTKIKYSIPHVVNANFASTTRVRLKVYNILGREVATLVNEEKHAGVYVITWDAKNLSSGVYFYKIEAGNYIAAKKMVLIK